MADDNQPPAPTPQTVLLEGRSQGASFGTARPHVGGKDLVDIPMAMPEPTGAEQHDQLSGNPIPAPSVSNAPTFVPEPMWDTPIRRRSVTEYARDQQPGFVPGAFQDSAFQTGVAANTSVGLQGVAATGVAGSFVTDPPAVPPMTAHAGSLEGSTSTPLFGWASPAELAAAKGSSILGTTLANRDAVLVKSTTVRLLLTAVIDRAKAERSNSTSVAELEVILTAVDGLHDLLSATSISPASVNAKVVSFKEGVLNWWARDHVEILSNSFNGALFAALMELSGQIGLVQTVTIATMLKGKDVVKALTALVKILRGDDEKDDAA